MPQIRQYQNSDRDQMFELAQENYAALTPASKPVDVTQARTYFEHIINIPNSGSGQLLVAEDGGQLLGFVCLLGPLAATEHEEDGEPYAFMSDLFVRESHRCQGIGGSLVSRVEDLACDMGIGKLALRVAADDPIARRFYSRHHYDEKFVVMSKDIRRTRPA
jgi:GNAT superfamily N-acetyltransferase